MKGEHTLHSHSLTYMLSSIQADIQVVKTDINYMKQFVDSHDTRFEKVENDVQEIQKHVSMVQGGVKLIGILGVILGIIVSLGRLPY